MFVLAQVVFWPRTEWAAAGGREPDTPLELAPTASVHPWPPFSTPYLLLYLALFCFSFLYFSSPLLVLSLLSVYPLTCTWLTAALVELDPWWWPHFYDLLYISCRFVYVIHLKSLVWHLITTCKARQPYIGLCCWGSYLSWHVFLWMLGPSSHISSEGNMFALEDRARWIHQFQLGNRHGSPPMMPTLLVSLLVTVVCLGLTLALQ